MKNVLVFRTDVKTVDENEKALGALNNILRQDEKATLDLEDIDKVLRVECTKTSAEEIQSLFLNEGFICIELEDVVYPIDRRSSQV